MYQQPLHHQQTWSSAQFAQAPKPPTISTWPSAPVIHTVQNGPMAAVSHPAPHHSFVPPAPAGVNPQQWQNGRWIYTAPQGGVNNAQPQGQYPPPNMVGWNIPAGWGITPQYYHPPQRRAEPSYWDTELSDNGLGLQNMHIKQSEAHAVSDGKGKTPHTPWAWVPRELDDDSPPPSTSSTQYRSAFQSQQPSPVEPSGRQNSTTASVAPSAGGSTGYPGPAQASHAYFSIPAEQQQQQHQQPSANTGSGSRPVLPPATTYSSHIRQRSNPQQTATGTHHHPPAAAVGSQSTLPSRPTANTQTSQRSHGLAAPTPQRPGQPESYTSVRQLRPTFSPAIVRTPTHYLQDSQPVVPSPRVAPWDDANSNTNGAGASTSANRHLSGALQGVVPSPRVLPWNAHARENDGGSPTPAPRHPRSSRTEPSRMYERSTGPTQTVQRSYSIPEPPRPMIPVSRQNSMPTVTGPDTHHLHGLSSIGNLPQFAEEPDSVMSLSPLVGTEPSESSESSTSTTVHAESPQPLFIPPRHSRSPSPSPRHRRSRAVSPSSSSSSSPSSSDSEDSDSRGDDPHHHRHRHHHHSSRRYRSPSHLHNRHRTSGSHQNNSNSHYGGGGIGSGATYTGTPQGRSPASSTHTYRSSSSSNPLPTPPQERRDPGFSLPPPQQKKPPRGTYRRSLRYGYWNRRGDYLTMDKYVVYAPHNRANPPELEGYPAPTEGYKDHYGNFIKYDPSRSELPESLPRQGLPPVFPYDKFVTYVYL